MLIITLSLQHTNKLCTVGNYILTFVIYILVCIYIYIYIYIYIWFRIIHTA